MALSAQTDAPGAHAERLRITVSQQATTITITLDGEWDLAAQDTMRNTVGRALARQPRHLILDLSHVNFIDSSGVHATVNLAERAARLKIELQIIPGHRTTQRTFEICQLTQQLPFTTPPSPK